MGALGWTLRDACIGFGTGLVTATAAAVLSLLSRQFEHTAMPIATLLRSVPLVTLTPLVVLIFGRGTAMIAVMGGLVVFFPAFVTVAAGLRTGPGQALDLVRACGGGRWNSLWRVSLPAAVPSIFAAARVSVPGSLIGALVGEWLGTGKGIGSSMIKAIPQYDYPQLWASIVVVTTVSIVCHALVGACEQVVASRFG